MKKLFFPLLLLFCLATTAQTIPSFPTINLTKTTQGTVADSLVIINGNRVKHLPTSALKSIKQVTGTDGVTVANGTTNPVIGISAIPQLKVAGLVTDLSLKVEKVSGKSLLSDAEIARLISLQNFDNSANVTAFNTKVDKVTNKSLILDSEITRLATLSNYTHPTNHPPSIITQDTGNRFVTDAEKATWNAKQNALGFTPENITNKSDSFTVSSTVTYANTKALVDGLATKQNTFIANVKDFGAMGNGITDDTSSINLALASLPAKGGTLYFPNGTYNTLNGITIVRDNIKILGELMPRTATSFIKLEGGTIVNGQFLIDGNNITVENIGFDFGITYSNTYKSGQGGNALVIHESNLASIKKNINVSNVIGLIRMGNFNDPQAAYHAILIEGVQFGTANNVTGVGGWFGVVVKATDFLMSNITGLENDAASIYIKSNSYAPSNRVTAVNLTTANFTARGNIGVLIQSSDAEMESISVSNVTVGGGNVALRVESEVSQPVVGFSLNGMTTRNVVSGVSIRGQVYSPVISNVSVFNPTNEGFVLSQNSVAGNPIEATVSNFRVKPSATTVNAFFVQNPNAKVICSNINVADSDGVTLQTGSVINLSEGSKIENYTGLLKIAGVTSPIYNYKGGGLTTSIANIFTTALDKKDFANPTLSLASGYLGSDNPYMQSYNNINNTANRFDINPFGGTVVFGGAATFSSSVTAGNIGFGSKIPTDAGGTSSTIESINGVQIAARTAVPQLYISSNISGSPFSPTRSVDGFASQISLDSFGGIMSFNRSITGLAGSAISWIPQLSFNNTGAATFSSSVTATAHVTTGGTAAQFVKGDGSLSSTGPDSRPYKVYTALLNQSGTSAPVATVLENTLGGAVVWSRNSLGIYYGTLSNAFSLNKTFLDCSVRYNGTTVIFRQDANRITVVTTNPSQNNVDDYLVNNSVEIRVYN